MDEIKSRVDELISRMTATEKAGQLTQYFYFRLPADADARRRPWTWTWPLSPPWSRRLYGPVARVRCCS